MNFLVVASYTLESCVAVEAGQMLKRHLSQLAIGYHAILC